jgi:hypothetical protein
MPSPRVWREIPQRYRLEAGKCKRCQKIFFPPRLICDKCKSREFETINLSQEGVIVSFTTIRVAPAEFSLQTPYNIAIIELKEGIRLTAQVVDCKPEDLAIGKKVRLAFRKLQVEGHSGIRSYGYKWVLA